MQLLTVGHSFSKPEADPSRFRMVRRGWLPKFGQAEEVPVDPTAALPAQRGTRPEGTDRAPVVERYPHGRWTLPERPVFQLPERPKVLIQKSALKLDQVRVVRNDLTDVDLELFPQRRPVAGGGVVASPAPVHGTGRALAGKAASWMGSFLRTMRRWWD
jgi:hypothetical protein